MPEGGRKRDCSVCPPLISFETWVCSRIFYLLFAAPIFLAECHQANVGIAKIIEDAAADLSITSSSGEHLVGTTVARARRIGERHSDDPINDAEIAGILVAAGNQLGLTAVLRAVGAVIV